MKIALVHDYLKEFGGAERVLRVLADMYPQAPIYTAFQIPGSPAAEAFKDRQVHESFLAPLLKIWRLYSPLRFLAPLVWKSLDLSEFDVVITSASWYITRGFKVGKKTKVICYCHTPPRYLYGYETSIDFQKYWPVKLYAVIVNHLLRLYDFRTIRTVNKWIVNSKNVQDRVKKFYKVESQIVYPPVEVKRFEKIAQKVSKQKYFLIVSRLVGAKGLEQAAQAAGDLGFQLKISGAVAGFSDLKEKLVKLGKGKVELLGRVSDEDLALLYAKAQGFIALARDEDFGMTVVEAQAAGTPVLAFDGGGFKESVIDGKTGILINDVSAAAIADGLQRFYRQKWDKKIIQKNAERFCREGFEKQMTTVVKKISKE